LILVARVANALTVKKNEIRNKSVFGITFPSEDRSYYGKEDNVQSVSIQEYVTATFHVLEVNVVSNGPALLRIYHSRPLSDLLTGAAQASELPRSDLIRSPLPKNVESMIDSIIRQTADLITDITIHQRIPARDACANHRISCRE